MGTVSEELYVGWSQAGDVPVSIDLGVEVERGYGAWALAAGVRF